MTEERLKIIQFKKKEPAPREDVISALETILEKAKSGDLDAVYLAALHVDGDVSTIFSSTDDYFKAIGAVEWLKKRILEEHDR